MAFRLQGDEFLTCEQEMITEPLRSAEAHDQENVGTERRKKRHFPTP